MLLKFEPQQPTLRDALSPKIGIHSIAQDEEHFSEPGIRVKRSHHLATAVFDLPNIPRLPRVKNTFEVPIQKMRIERPHEYLSAAFQSAGVRGNVKQAPRFPDSALPQSLFPMTLTDTTPLAMIEEYERHSGIRLYFDAAEMKITDQKPESAFEKWKKMLGDQWQRHKPSWFP